MNIPAFSYPDRAVVRILALGDASPCAGREEWEVDGRLAIFGGLTVYKAWEDGVSYKLGRRNPHKPWNSVTVGQIRHALNLGPLPDALRHHLHYRFGVRELKGEAFTLITLRWKGDEDMRKMEEKP